MSDLRYVPLDDWIASAAARRPDHPALIAGGRTLTYAELDREVTDRARSLSGSALLPGPGAELVIALHACLRAGVTAVALDPRMPAPPTELPEAADTVLLTSGTTAEPRPVALSARHHEASARALGERLGLGPGDRWLCALPTWHVGGMAIVVRAAVFAATVVVHERFEAARVRGELASGGITHVSLVSTMLRRLEPLQAPALEALLLGGGPIPAQQLEGDLPVVPTYGMTETASAVATGTPGEPLAGVELRIAADGEILVRGPMVAAEGWLNTGDRGSIDEEGRLTVDGRLGDTIITGGEKVAPARVEAALETHPAVAEAGVVGLPDPEWGEVVTAFVVGEAAEADLLAHVRESLAPHEVPKVVRFVGDLPRNQAGKLLRSDLRRLESPPR